MAEDLVIPVDIFYPELTTTQKLSWSAHNYYLIWKLKISFVLTYCGVHHVLTHSDSSDPKWLKDESTARNRIIIPALDDDLQLHYYTNHNAKSIMESLETLFNNRSVTRTMNLLSSYRRYRMAPDTPVNRHIFRMRSMAKELEYAGAKFPEEFHSALLLDSLPEDWRDDLERLMFDLDSNKEEFDFLNVSRRLRIASDIRKLRAFNSSKTCKYNNKSKKASSTRKTWSLDQEDFSLPLGLLKYRFLKMKDRLDSSGANFSYWTTEVQSIFEENKLSYVLCDQKPADGDPKQTKWLADDLVCRHLILGALGDELFLSFHDYPTAKLLMDAINIFFKCSTVAGRLFRLKKYMDYHMSEDTPVTDHICKMDKLARKLRISGIAIPNEMQAVTLMDSLPDSWEDSMVVVRENMAADKVDLFDVQRKLRGIGELKQLRSRDNVVETSSPHYGSKYRKGLKGNCYACGRAGHYKSDCPNRGAMR